MRIFILAAALAATVAPSVLMTQPAFAQERHDGRGDNHGRGDRSPNNRGHDDHGRDNRGSDNRGHDNRGNNGRGHDGRNDRRGDNRPIVIREQRRDIHYYANQRPDRRVEWREYRRYDYNRPDLRYGNRYDAARYYRADSSYRERRLNRNDRIYRGDNGRYYCRRSDGTTGLIIGALAGGLLGNTIANGQSNTLGTLLGAGGGALIGRSIDRGEARCR